MRHPFDGIMTADEAKLGSDRTAAEASRRSFLGRALAVVGGAAGLLVARESVAQTARRGTVTTQALGEEGGPGRDQFRSQRPATPPGRDQMGGPGRSEFGQSRGSKDRVTTLALGEEGGPGRNR